jgi:hypothetical protein
VWWRTSGTTPWTPPRSKSPRRPIWPRSRNGSTKAASIAKAAQACADAGNTKQGIAIALDVEQLVYEVNTLLNAASLINRISKG